MFDRLTQTVAPGSALAKMAPGLDWTLMLGADHDQWLVCIRDGAVHTVTKGPFVLPSWQTRITATPQEWQAFWAPIPRPGHHDIIALLRRGAITFEGDLHPLMSNLMYTKEMLASLRAEVAQ